MVGQIVSRFLVVVKEDGIRTAFSKMTVVVKGLLRRQNSDDFDASLHVDTAGEMSLWRLNIPSKNAKFGCKYQTTAPAVFQEALAVVSIPPQQLTFIDLGCGKGRTLILAARKGFKRVVGVEFSAALASLAQQNVQRVGVCAEVVEADAADFSFPDDDLLIYMYNPFGSTVMKAVIANLLAWHDHSRKTAFIVYVNPTCAGAFDSSPRLERLHVGRSFRAWTVH